MDVGETEVSALQAGGELSMVEAEFVALVANVTALSSRSGHPHGEGFDVAIAADRLPVFAHRRTTKFTAPDDKGVS